MRRKALITSIGQTCVCTNHPIQGKSIHTYVAVSLWHSKRNKDHPLDAIDVFRDFRLYLPPMSTPPEPLSPDQSRNKSQALSQTVIASTLRSEGSKILLIAVVQLLVLLAAVYVVVNPLVSRINNKATDQLVKQVEIETKQTQLTSKIDEAQRQANELIESARSDAKQLIDSAKAEAEQLIAENKKIAELNDTLKKLAEPATLARGKQLAELLNLEHSKGTIQKAWEASANLRPSIARAEYEQFVLVDSSNRIVRETKTIRRSSTNSTIALLTASGVVRPREGNKAEPHIQFCDQNGNSLPGALWFLDKPTSAWTPFSLSTWVELSPDIKSIHVRAARDQDSSPSFELHAMYFSAIEWPLP